MRPVSLLRVSSKLFLAFVCLVSASMLAQSKGNLQPLPNHSPNGFAGAENRWRLTAVDPLKQLDTVDPAKRAARNAYWRPYLETFKALEKNGNHVVMPSGSSPTPVEIISDPDAVWVVATFDHFLVIPIDPDSTLIYTELNFTVDRVISRPSDRLKPSGNSKPIGGSIKVGSSFDVYIPGGRVKVKDGSTVSRLVQPSASSPQPSHKYIMEITPVGVEHWIIAKRWDITSGTVQGKNTILAGMDEDDAVRQLLATIEK